MSQDYSYSPGLAPRFVRVKLRLPGGKTKSIWAKKMKNKHAGYVTYLKVNEEGECKSWEDSKGIIHENKEFYVGTLRDVISERPAEISLKYGWLEVVDIKP